MWKRVAENRKILVCIGIKQTPLTNKFMGKAIGTVHTQRHKENKKHGNTQSKRNLHVPSKKGKKTKDKDVKNTKTKTKTKTRKGQMKTRVKKETTDKLTTRGEKKLPSLHSIKFVFLKEGPWVWFAKDNPLKGGLQGTVGSLSLFNCRRVDHTTNCP